MRPPGGAERGAEAEPGRRARRGEPTGVCVSLLRPLPSRRKVCPPPSLCRHPRCGAAPSNTARSQGAAGVTEAGTPWACVACPRHGAARLGGKRHSRDSLSCQKGHHVSEPAASMGSSGRVAPGRAGRAVEDLLLLTGAAAVLCAGRQSATAVGGGLSTLLGSASCPLGTRFCGRRLCCSCLPPRRPCLHT